MEYQEHRIVLDRINTHISINLQIVMLESSYSYTNMTPKFDSLWLPYGIGKTIIFSSCRLFFFLLFYFPRLISAVADWMSAIIAHMV